MTVECTNDEAKILITALLYAEGAAADTRNDAMSEAIKALRPFRTALLEAFLHSAYPLPGAASRG